MRLGNLYRKAVATGIENDPRGKTFVLQELDRRKKEFNKLNPDERDFFDSESLENPYSDSRILFGDEDSEVITIFTGIDIDVGEILLADTLRARGKKIDLLLSHHPSGRALANLSSVMQMQSDILNTYGVPINIAEGLMDGRIKEVERKLMPVNHTRAVDAARLLGLPFLCLHTPADNMVTTFLQRLFDTEKPYTLSDVLTLLKDIPEYKTAGRESFGPNILLGQGEQKGRKNLRRYDRRHRRFKRNIREPHPKRREYNRGDAPQ